MNQSYTLSRNTVIEGLLKKGLSIAFRLIVYPENIQALNEHTRKSEEDETASIGSIKTFSPPPAHTTQARKGG